MRNQPSHDVRHPHMTLGRVPHAHRGAAACYHPGMRDLRLRAVVSAALLLALASCTSGEGSPAPAPVAAADRPPADVMLVASKNGEVYHLPTCKWALEISTENRVEYETAGKARSAGKRRCKECAPP